MIMKRLFAGLAAALLGATAAQALPITQFQRFTNDGVHTLNAAQAAWLGAPTADRIAFLRLRNGGGLAYAAGDTFDAATLLGSTANDDKLLGLLNGLGDPTLIAYSGSPYAVLGTTTMLSASDVYAAVAFVFRSDAGSIVFTGRNSATFDGGQTRGDYTALVPPAPDDLTSFDGAAPTVPLPGALALMLVALGGFAGLRARRRA
jgi:hypothetical protein